MSILLCAARLSRVGATLCALNLTCLPLLAQWSTAQGGNPARTSRSAGFGPLQPVPLWSYGQQNEMALQPVVAGDLVVASHSTDFVAQNGTEIIAHELSTGVVRWKTILPPSLSGFGFVSRVVGYDSGRIYAIRGGPGLTDENLYALSPVDGSILWQSEDLVNLAFSATPTFLSNGDLITNGEWLGNFYRYLRIDAATGKTVWDQLTLTSAELSGGAVHGDRLYVLGATAAGVHINRYDIQTGVTLYQSSTIGDASFEQAGNLMAGPDGTIYVPTTRALGGGQFDGQLTAYSDTGNGFELLWRIPAGSIVWSSLGIGPDGSVYAWSPAGGLMRVDPETGAVLNNSIHMAPGVFTGRMAIDDSGTVFAYAADSWVGMLAAFDAELNLLWQQAAIANPVGGPSLAADGTLILSTNSSGLQTWRDPQAGCTGIATCDSTTNSSGRASQLDYSGSTSVTANDLVLEVQDAASGVMGVWMYGGTDTEVPLGDGLLCVGSPLFRLGVTATSSQGRTRTALDLTNLPPAGQVLPGSTWYFQYVFRDLAAGGTGVNTSSGLAVMFCQ